MKKLLTSVSMIYSCLADFHLLRNFFRDEEKEQISGKVLAEIDKWLERFDCLVVGPGLGRDPFLLVCFFGPIDPSSFTYLIYIKLRCLCFHLLI